METYKAKLLSSPLMWGGQCWVFKAIRYTGEKGQAYTIIFQDDAPIGVYHNGQGFAALPADGDDTIEHSLWLPGMHKAKLTGIRILFNDTLNTGLQGIDNAAGLLARIAGMREHEKLFDALARESKTLIAQMR